MPVKKKAKAKAKPKFTGKPSFLWAKRGKGPRSWMPLEVVVNLEGEKTGKLLVICGWSVTTSDDDDAWPADRIEANMARIRKEWTADYGRGWKLRIDNAEEP
jgi:hypothetical protein